MSEPVFKAECFDEHPETSNHWSIWERIGPGSPLCIAALMSGQDAKRIAEPLNRHGVARSPDDIQRVADDARDAGLCGWGGSP